MTYPEDAEEAAADSVEGAEVVTVQAEANAEPMADDKSSKAIHVVPVFSYTIGGIEFTVGTDGALIVSAARRDEPAYGRSPDDIDAPSLFLTKLPRVGPLPERVHTERHHCLYGDMETKKHSEGFDTVSAQTIAIYIANQKEA